MIKCAYSSFPFLTLQITGALRWSHLELGENACRMLAVKSGTIFLHHRRSPGDHSVQLLRFSRAREFEQWRTKIAVRRQASWTRGRARGVATVRASLLPPRVLEHILLTYLTYIPSGFCKLCAKKRVQGRRLDLKEWAGLHSRLTTQRY